MAERKKFPSLPSNYVSILQLRERWMREREQKLSEEVDNLQPELVDRKSNHDGERCEEPNSKLNLRKTVAFCSNSEGKDKDNHVSDAVAKRRPPVEAPDEDRNPDDPKHKKYKKKKKKKKKAKSKRVEDVIGETGPASTEIVEMKNIPARRNVARKGEHGSELLLKRYAAGSGEVSEGKDCLTVKIKEKMEEVKENIPTRRNNNSRNGNQRLEWRLKSENAVASGKVTKDILTVQIEEKMVEIEQKIGDLLVDRRNEEERERTRSRFKRNAGGIGDGRQHMAYGRISGGGGCGGRHLALGRLGGGGGEHMASVMYGGGRIRVKLPKEGSLVWVKKE